MSNTPKKPASCRNAIAYLEDRPCYELTADEIVFPVEFRRAGILTLGYFAMEAQVASRELKECLKATMPAWVQTASARRSREDKPTNKDSGRAVALKHFRQIYEAKGSVEAQRHWLERNPGIQWKLYEEGYNQILPDVPLEADVDPLDFETEFQNSARTKRLLYCPEKKAVEEIQIHHVFKTFSQRHVRIYDQASKVARGDRGGELLVNWDVLQIQLYDPLIEHVEGMLIDGQPCDESNKNKWIKLVPFLDKMSAVMSVFREDAEKNVQ